MTPPSRPLQSLALLDRAAGLTAGALLAEEPSLERKLALSVVAHGAMERAAELQRAVDALERSQPGHRGVPDTLASWVSAQVAGRRLAELLASAKVQRGRVLSDLDLLCFERTRATLWRHARDPTAASDAPSPPTPSNQGPLTPPERAITAPTDRLLTPARPADAPPTRPGQLRPSPANPHNDPDDLALFLHRHLVGEVTTLELLGRCSYEHPDLPLAFHRDMARQIDDERRHAQLLQRLARQRGLPPVNLPLYTTTYDTMYAFEQVEPGSLRELLWRLLLRGVCQEGQALDDLAFQVRRWRHVGQPEVAELFEAILVDEGFHVGAALRWSRWICAQEGLDWGEELDAAQTALSLTLWQRRQRWEREHPEQARLEVEQARPMTWQEDVPFRRQPEWELRRQAGYSEEEHQRVMAWAWPG